MVPLKYPDKFWRTLEMSFINCEIDLLLTWSANCFLVAGVVANQVPTFAITDTKTYVPFLTSSTQDNVKISFYIDKINIGHQTSYKQYFLPTIEIKDYNVLIKYLGTNDIIQKIATSEGNDYTDGCLLDSTYFKKYFKLLQSI